MPNEVYDTAVQGLGSLVSPRAATRMIDAALRATGRTPEDVSAVAMRKLLLGRVRRELQGVLPSAGLDAGLNRVADELSSHSRAKSGGRHRTAAPSGAQERPNPSDSAGASVPERRRGFSLRRRRKDSPDQDAASSDAVSQPTGRFKDTDTPLSEALLDPASLSTPEAVKRSSVYLPGLDVPEELRPARETGGEHSVFVAGDAARVAAADSAVPAARTGRAEVPYPARVLDDALTEAAVKVFAEVETVRQIVITQGTRVLQTRGSGVDAQRLAPLAVSTRRLLERAGQLHVYSIERAGGVLFLFPVLDGTVTVLTQPNVNIGAVLAARAALEEAA